MSSLERHAIQRLVDKATAAGVEIPAEVTGLFGRLDCTSYAGRVWAEAHPDEQRPPCCYGAINGPEHCTCWEPVYDIVQQEPRPIGGPDDLKARSRMCGDCAFRPGSPERTDEWAEEALLDLTGSATTPFWCHDGMRRPARWEHPDGRTVPGSPDDWRPVALGSVPYRADGSPGLLCAGWAALAAAKTREVA